MSNENNPIVFAKPPKPVSQMTDEEIEQWARRLVTGMRQDNGEKKDEPKKQ